MHESRIRVAAVQMVSSSEVGANLLTAGELIDRAAADGARLVLLPENWPIIGITDRDKLRHREPYGSGPLQEFLSRQAARHGIWLVGGSIPLDAGSDDRVYGSCLLFDPGGICAARYDKIHLFDVTVDAAGGESYRESATLAPGARVTVAHTPFAGIGLSVCYDLRFPELYRSMLADEARIFTVPSAFTETTGRRHWELLLRARAVENLCFVIAANQGGRHDGGRETWGHSMIIDPWGDILAAMDKGTGIICATLDLDRQRDLRASFPALQHATLLR